MYSQLTVYVGPLKSDRVLVCAYVFGSVSPCISSQCRDPQTSVSIVNPLCTVQGGRRAKGLGLYIRVGVPGESEAQLDLVKDPTVE